MRKLITYVFIVFWVVVYGQDSKTTHLEAIPNLEVDVSLATKLKWHFDLKPKEELILKDKLESPFGEHYRFEHTLDNKEVLFSGVNCHIKNDGSITIQNFLASSDHVTTGTLPYYFSTKNGLITVRIEETNVNHQALKTYRDVNGSVVCEFDEHKYYQDTTVKVKVFDINPINSANTTYGVPYVDAGDANNASLDSQRFWKDVDARFSNDTFYLASDYITIKDNGTSQILDTLNWQYQNDSFDYPRNERFFEVANVYYHINTMADYVKSLGYSSLLVNLKVDPHGFSGDNSWFSPGNFSLTFGVGGVDDGEDGEVIIHEYTHALSEKASLGTTIGTQRESMEEGTCDYLCKSYSRSVNDNTPNKIFSWDGHNQFWDGFGINTDRYYPDDLANTKDGDRDMWSSALMCGHDAIGRETMDSLVLEHLLYQGPNTTMTQMAQIILDIDSADFNKRNYAALKGCFVNAGFLKYGAGVDNSNELTLPVKVFNSSGFNLGESALIIETKSYSHLRVYNGLGQLISEDIGSRFQLEPHNFAKGLFLLELESHGSITTLKVVR